MRRPEELVRGRGFDTPLWTGTKWLFSRWTLDVECLVRKEKMGK